jgi:hypothetical protein
MLTSQALAYRNMSEELQTKFHAVIRVINYVKTERKTATLCNNMQAEHREHLYECETCLLSHVKLFHRVYELNEETATFLHDSNNNDANLCYNEDFIQKLAYLIDIFEKLSNMNKSMQGSQISVLTLNNNVNGFMKNFELWKSNNECNIFEVSYF